MAAAAPDHFELREDLVAVEASSFRGDEGRIFVRLAVVRSARWFAGRSSKAAIDWVVRFTAVALLLWRALVTVEPPLGPNRDLQHSVALMSEEIVRLDDLIESERMRH